MIELRPIDSLRPSDYNPRVRDQQRLELVSLSLEKLGWLSPLYAAPDGLIISGHQRLTAARALGAEHVPVVMIAPPMEHQTNILFNRITNDMDPGDFGRDLLQKITPDTLAAVAARPSIPLTSPEAFRCMNTRTMNNAEFRRRYARPSAESISTVKALDAAIPLPPIVVSPTRCVNGAARAYLNSRPVTVLDVSEEEADLAHDMLNYLSMDYDFTVLADVLRHTNFRRASNDRKWGVAFRALLPRKAVPTSELWRARVGDGPVVDFGAGHGHRAELLRDLGIRVDEFEPYRPVGNYPDLVVSRTLAEEFLTRVAAGPRYSAVILNSVLNSVPFAADRDHVLRVVASLASPGTLVSAAVIPKPVQGPSYMHKHGSSWLDYEPGMTINTELGLMKTQKWFSEHEFTALFRRFFRTVTYQKVNGQHSVIARDPLPLPRADAEESIRFEFNMPYPAGATLGLGDAAVAAFTTGKLL